MTVTANIIEVLRDGTIITASFAVPSIISITISRDNVDLPFTITSCDVQSSDESLLSEAVVEIQKTMQEHEIDLMIPVVNKYSTLDYIAIV